MNADGSGEAKLTANADDDVRPAWSPDGTRIAFTSDRDGDGEIYVMNADGSGQTNLTSNPADDDFPAWSPDGKKIAFVSDRAGNDDVYVMNTDGSGPARLTVTVAFESAPAWSPDGTRIAFELVDDSGISQIYAMNADGSDWTKLTSGPAENGAPEWSPDGKKIAFVSDRDGNDEIYVMNANGSGQSSLTSTPEFHYHPAWSPDGTRIAFTSPCGVCVVGIDGSDLGSLGSGSEPDWQPLSRARTADLVVTAEASRDLVAFGQEVTYTVTLRNTGPAAQATGVRLTGVLPGGLDLVSARPSRGACQGTQTLTCTIGTLERYGPLFPKGFAPPEVKLKIVARAVKSGDVVATASASAAETDPNPTSSAARIQTTVAGEFERIVFVQDGDLYVMNVDGSGERRVTTGLKNAGRPDWSPDGTRIAFEHAGGIAVVGAGGGRLKQLTTGGAYGPDEAPAWLPDGRTIVFLHASFRQSNIYRIRDDGSDLSRLVNSVGGPPFVSRSGAIGFLSDRGTELDALSAKGVLTKLTSKTIPGGLEDPAWSPDERKIGFWISQGLGEIWVMNADGSGQTRFEDQNFDREPAWSLDGRWMIFRRAGRIHVSRADGSDAKPIRTQGAAPDWGWSTYVKQIVPCRPPSCRR